MYYLCKVILTSSTNPGNVKPRCPKNGGFDMWKNEALPLVAEESVVEKNFLSRQLKILDNECDKFLSKKSEHEVLVEEIEDIAEDIGLDCFFCQSLNQQIERSLKKLRRRDALIIRIFYGINTFNYLDSTHLELLNSSSDKIGFICDFLMVSRKTANKRHRFALKQLQSKTLSKGLKEYLG